MEYSSQLKIAENWSIKLLEFEENKKHGNPLTRSWKNYEPITKV